MYTPSTKRPANSNVITILLKTLIFGHLEVLDYHPGLAPAGVRCHARPYVFSDLRYRPRQRVCGDDVDFQVLRGDHNPGDFLAALVGCGLHEAPAPQGVDPFGREGRDRGGPRELNSVCQNKPSALVNRSLLDPLLFLGLLLAALLLQLALPLLLGVLLWEEDVGDRYVHLVHAQADQALHPVGHVAPDGLGQLGYRLAVLRRQRQVDGGLLLADLHRDALGLAAAATAGDASQDAAHGLGAPAAHPDAVYLLGGDAGYLRYHAVRDARRAPLGLERALGTLFAHASPFVKVLCYAARRVISRYIASKIIAPRVATRMDVRLMPVNFGPLNSHCTTKPPTNAPTIPIRIVIIIPPGSGPGITHLASAPAMSPITINATIPMRFHLPQVHTSFSHQTAPASAI